MDIKAELTKTVDVGGKKIPEWVFVVAGVVAVIAIATHKSSAETPAATADAAQSADGSTGGGGGDVSPITPIPEPTPSPAPSPAVTVPDTSNQVESLFGGLQSQLDSLFTSARTRATQNSAALQAQQAPVNTNFAAEHASALSSLQNVYDAQQVAANVVSAIANPKSQPEFSNPVTQSIANRHDRDDSGGGAGGSFSVGGPGYTVQSGDTLSRIAKNAGVSLSKLLSWNPQITNPNLIHPGQTVNLGGGGAGGSSSVG